MLPARALAAFSDRFAGAVQWSKTSGGVLARRALSGAACLCDLLGQVKRLPALLSFVSLGSQDKQGFRDRNTLEITGDLPLQADETRCDCFGGTAPK
jgi:hypothetical protein